MAETNPFANFNIRSSKKTPTQKISSAPTLPTNLIIFSLITFLAALGFYLFLAGYKSVTESQIENLDREIQDTVATLSASEVERVLTLDKQIKTLRSLLPQHVYSSIIFSTLEQNTNPKIIFNSLSFDSNNNKLSLNGNSPSLEDIATQAAAFGNITGIKEVKISDIAKAGDGYDFKFEITLDNNFLLANQL
ncbi:MAG TPA: hypothetical protein PLA57_02050 [Candidatus Paceibacterota bacterium]|jgi:hypothetical protein|nr:hypothetical protein [Candidatus Paceibacterota bacterium]HRS47916.1 hypothetical protein [Candidatus Paceibacterota bacterium]